MSKAIATRQAYGETLCEIERMKGLEQKDDEIDELISERTDGMPGAVREDRSTV